MGQCRLSAKGSECSGYYSRFSHPCRGEPKKIEGTEFRYCLWPAGYVQTLIERRRVQGYILFAIMSHRVVYETSFLVVLCVLSLFLFPASAGPYPAVHGPATALQAARSCTQLQASIHAVPRTCAEKSFLPFSPARFANTAANNDFAFITRHGAESVLRC